MRPDKDNYFMTLAWAASRRSTCVRRAVGCVLVNGLGHIVGTGYNGRPRGFDHCNHIGDGTEPYLQDPQYPFACYGAFDPPGSKPETCDAVHAEQNALLQCYDTLWVRTAYVTVSPCVPCTKILLNSGCQRIVFVRESSDSGRAGELWTRNNSAIGGGGALRTWCQVDVPNPS